MYNKKSSIRSTLVEDFNKLPVGKFILFGNFIDDYSAAQNYSVMIFMI